MVALSQRDAAVIQTWTSPTSILMKSRAISCGEAVRNRWLGQVVWFLGREVSRQCCVMSKKQLHNVDRFGLGSPVMAFKLMCTRYTYMRTGAIRERHQVVQTRDTLGKAKHKFSFFWAELSNRSQIFTPLRFGLCSLATEGHSNHLSSFHCEIIFTRHYGPGRHLCPEGNRVGDYIE